jgi:hypothetical protein
MYAPMSNAGVSAIMRWPVTTLSLASVIGTVTNSVPGMIIAWGTSVALCTYAAMEYYKEELSQQDCHCPEPDVISWVIEYDTETGSKRPYELHTVRNGDMSTKEYYASYSTEEKAMKKKNFFEQAMASEETEEQ